MTREQELAAAIEAAKIPASDYRIFCALLRQRAEWKTGEIPEKFQPHGLADLARMTHMSKANLCRGLNRLEGNGWISRHRATGRRTAYQLAVGANYGIGAERPEPRAMPAGPAGTGRNRNG